MTAALASDLLEPIAGENPAGPSLRGELVYQQIRQARFEEDDVPQGDWKRERKTADYALVVKLATDVLARQSKDLQVAAWLTEAWTRRQGFAGFAAGVELMLGMMERFWDHLHPEIEDGDLELRAAPLEWIDLYLGASLRLAPLTKAGHGAAAYAESRKVGSEEEAKGDEARLAEWRAAVEAGKVSAEAFDRGVEETPGEWLRERRAELDAGAAALDALQAFSRERLGDAAPAFLKLREALDEVRRLAGQLLAKKGEPEPEASAADASSSTEPGDGATAVEIAAGVAVSAASGGDGDAPPSPSLEAGPPRTREEAAARLAALARHLRRERPADPAPYLVLRGFRWGELRGGGPSPDPRLLAAPPTAERVRLKTLLLEERWAELLDAAEETMAQPQGRGWLDLQRYSAAACAALGEAYDALRAALAAELRALLQAVPALPAMTLMDDTPAANAETLAWLREAGLVSADGAEAAPPPAPSPGAAAERARARAAAGEPERAVEILVAAAAQERSERARFLHRSQAAAVLVDAGKAAVAVPILRQLLEQVERHQLEAWEAGEVVAGPLALLHRALSQAGDGQGEREGLYLRVCRLDPVRAMQLAGSADAAA
ncbi:MAG TPA: type VI secretion system protein TssA [Longimicrobium sp.]